MQAKGFTLLEILVAVAIIGLTAALVIPNFMGRTAKYARRETIAKLNALTNFAWRNALIDNKIYKVNFNLKAGQPSIISIEVETGIYEKGEPTFKSVDRAYTDTEFEWPEHLEIKQFLIEKFDEMSRFRGRKTESVWFYIMPDGLTQDVIINLVDIKDEMSDGRPRPVGLVLNPFSAQFKVYDSFQK